jgi:hypothetical protein
MRYFLNKFGRALGCRLKAFPKIVAGELPKLTKALYFCKQADANLKWVDYADDRQRTD